MTVGTVALAALAFWSLNSQLAAGVGVSAAVAAVTTILLCVARIRRGRPDAAGARRADSDEHPRGGRG